MSVGDGAQAADVPPTLLYVGCGGAAGDGPDQLVVVEAAAEAAAVRHRLVLPYAADGIAQVARIGARRLLLVGARSSRLYVVAADLPDRPEIVRVVEPEALGRHCGLSGPHSAVVLPDGHVLISLVADRRGGPQGGFAVLHGGDFDLLGRWDEVPAAFRPGALAMPAHHAHVVVGSWSEPQDQGGAALCAWGIKDRRPGEVEALGSAPGPVALAGQWAAAGGAVWTWMLGTGGLELAAAEPVASGSPNPADLAQASPGGVTWVAAGGGVAGPLRTGSELGDGAGPPNVCEHLHLPGGAAWRLAVSPDARWLYATSAGHPAWDDADPGSWLWAVEVGTPAGGDPQRGPRRQWRCAPGAGPRAWPRAVWVVDPGG